MSKTPATEIALRTRGKRYGTKPRLRCLIGFSDRLIKWSTVVAVVCVAAVAAVVSYRHAYALVRAYGEDGSTAWLVPLTVDGLILANSMVLLHSARRQLPAPPLARWLLGLGIAATLAANSAHGLDYGVVGALVAAWPAIALVGTYELLMLLIRHTRQTPETTVEPTHGVEAIPATARNTSAGDAAAAGPNQERGKVRARRAVHAHSARSGSPLLADATKAFANELAAGRVPTIRAIRSRLRIGQTRAQRLRAHLAARLSDQAAGPPDQSDEAA